MIFGECAARNASRQSVAGSGVVRLFDHLFDWVQALG